MQTSPKSARKFHFRLWKKKWMQMIPDRVSGLRIRNRFIKYEILGDEPTRLHGTMEGFN